METPKTIWASHVDRARRLAVPRASDAPPIPKLHGIWQAGWDICRGMVPSSIVRSCDPCIVFVPSCDRSCDRCIVLSRRALLPSYGQAYFHKQCCMMHRDLKFQNVLVETMPTYETKGVFKITDFGISTACGMHDSECETPGAQTA